MRKNQTEDPAAAGAVGIGSCVFEVREAPEQAQRLRARLRDFVTRAVAGELPVHLPAVAAAEVARGSGHFHLAAELFLQVSGWTRFRFPHGESLLSAGEALLLPPRLLHAERVGTAAGDAAFCNLVIYAEGAAMTCHLAHESTPGRPGILHLETSHHPQAARVHDWLADAARCGHEAGGDAAAPLAVAQRRALVAAAAAGMLLALDDPSPAASPEPALIARARVLIQNQLGDPDLSVRRLAEQSGCTADYLSHLFARSTGEHLAGFIVRQRMERAARLLGESAMAGKEIAWACGFATQSYFIRSFHNHFGVTPRTWRSKGPPVRDRRISTPAG